MTTPFFNNDQISWQLTDGHWQADGLARHTFALPAGRTITVDMTGLTAAGQQLAQWALNAWTEVSGINFLRVSTGASITFDDALAGAFTDFYHSGSTTTSATVNISTDWLNVYGTGRDTYSMQTYVHEIGHALGLGHAGNYDGNATYGIDNLFSNDSWQATVMSYFSQDDNPTTNASFAFVVTPMIADIIAIQNLYGPAASHIGNDTYVFEDLFGVNNTAKTIFDTNGIDTFDFTNASQPQFIDIRPEHYSDIGGLWGNLGIARGTVIENVIGGRSDDGIIGNSADNWFDGQGGNDLIFGEGGRDNANYNVAQSSAFVFQFVEGAVVSSAYGNDILVDVETLSFTDGAKGLDLARSEHSILDYAASYVDLAAGYGTDENALFLHFADHGLAEGRAITFDSKLYLGAYADLRAGYHTDLNSAAAHFIEHGKSEGRSDHVFSSLEYIASYSDLIVGFGADASRGLSHFKQNGFYEGRGDNFNGLTYIASHSDLIVGFRDNSAVGTEHFIEHGYYEGRQTTFDAYSYLHAQGNGDLLAYFGGDVDGATRHYIDHGFYEGRFLA